METALIIDAEIAIAIASDNIEMHLVIKKCIKIDTYFRFFDDFQFVKWYFTQTMAACFVQYFKVLKLLIVIIITAFCIG